MDDTSYYEPATTVAKPKAITPVSVIVVCAILLLALGLPIVYSASSASKYGPATFVTKQLIGIGLGAVMAFIVSQVNLDRLRKLAWPILIIAVILLALTLLPGVGLSRNGSRRWLGHPSLSFQTSEFAKIAIVFFLAHYLTINQTHIHKFTRGFVIPLLVITAVVLPISQQKDIGTATLIFGVGVALLFLAGARLIHLVPTFLLGALGIVALVVTSANRMERFMAWINHADNKLGGGWQLEQALSAFAVGGVYGTGLGQGRQQLSFLPEAHTDFICAVIGEELGLIGTLGVVALFLIIFIAGLVHLRRAPNMFQYILAAGSILFLIMPALVNFYVVTGMGPTKGMSLPFVSYGMSNLMLAGVLVGVLLNNQRTWPRPAFSNRERLLKEIL